MLKDANNSNICIRFKTFITIVFGFIGKYIYLCKRIHNLKQLFEMKKLLFLTAIYFSLTGYGQNYTKDLENRAKAGDSDSQVELGLCYLNGEGVKQNYKKAQKYFESAADQMNAAANYWLGTMYENGTAKDNDRMFSLSYLDKVEINGKGEYTYTLPYKHYYSIAALNGHPEAAYILHLKSRSDRESLTWLSIAAKNGHAEAQYLMSFKTSDKEVQHAWLEMAAKQGHVEAQKKFSLIDEQIKAEQKKKEEEEQLKKERQIAEEKAKREEEEAERLSELCAREELPKRWKCNNGVSFVGEITGTQEGDAAWNLWGIDHSFFEGGVGLSLRSDGNALLVSEAVPSHKAMKQGQGRIVQVGPFVVMNLLKT